MATPLFRVALPTITDKTGAVVLRGHRMGAIRDGWLLLYEHDERPASDELIDQLVITKTADHRLVARFLKKGRRAGAWDLFTVTGDPELDVVLLWASPVTAIIPHAPSPDEIAALETSP